MQRPARLRRLAAAPQRARYPGPESTALSISDVREAAGALGVESHLGVGAQAAALGADASRLVVLERRGPHDEEEDGAPEEIHLGGRGGHRPQPSGVGWTFLG